MDKYASLYTKYGLAVRYLVVGGLTTGINIGLFFGLTYLQVPWFWANLCAWVLSVLFAFIANKVVVFASADTTLTTVVKEAVSFFALRAASLLADTAILFVGLTLLHGAPLLVKLIDQVVVIGLNYVFSKQIFA
ncbi:GtrA family protein [Lacticaseibacillus baoqingensis]|uniref:GtrA family protein n=1 Tax=Lacticaseibacillus baoqingensis TaxID=2486013 RepID=A0ABW4EC11_9LACO|nr:GtrA family protein [Lacticaseibacillus baoqingensis]